MKTFEYHLIPVADWIPHLDQFVAQPNKSVSVHLLWGEHEKIKGVRDFHSKPRLKIEKIFSLAHSMGLSVDITFGFTSDPKSFPDWVWALEPKSRVPSFNGSKLSRWALQKIPSVKSLEVREGFLAFFEEALSLIRLHTHPGGSVRSVAFDWGIFERECPAMESSQILDRLKRRYENPQKLNFIFQTHFRDFETASTPMGYKTLCKKRPWLILWDYQVLKNEALEQWEHPIRIKLEELGLEKTDRKRDLTESKGRYSTLLDDTLINIHPETSSVFPILFQEELDPLLVRAFRLAEALQEKAKERNEKIEPLSRWVPHEALRECSVFCQGFLPKHTFNQINKFLTQGGRVFFPFGLPKWDESMEVLPWSSEYFRGGTPAILIGKETQLNVHNLSHLYEQARQVFL